MMDGIMQVITCPVCGAPKKYIRDGREFDRECDCEAMARIRSEAKARIAERRAASAKRYERHFCESDGRCENAERIAIRYVERFEDAKMLDVNGLMLYGKVGKGKTFLASCIATELSEKGYAVNVMSMAELVARAMEHGFDRDTWLGRVLKCDLIVLDDLGVERSTDTANEIVFHAIDGIDRRRLPLVVTTNLNPKEMAQTQDLSSARIYSRIMGMCLPVEAKGEKGRVSRDAMREAMDLYAK